MHHYREVNTLIPRILLSSETLRSVKPDERFIGTYCLHYQGDGLRFRDAR
jgi:hypothetical protein